MPKGYWIARITVDDAERYKLYLRDNGPVFAKHGARFVVRAGRFEAPEGTPRDRNVVIEFPSYEAACNCYHSTEYQELARLRQTASHGDVIIIEGYDPPGGATGS